ncbi:MAG: hypothetical protein H7333_08925 [Bdellovibrionales bacterium]|nr:hypothetical protein [Oligoflexia bacterium]
MSLLHKPFNCWIKTTAFVIVGSFMFSLSFAAKARLHKVPVHQVARSAAKAVTKQASRQAIAGKPSDRTHASQTRVAAMTRQSLPRAQDSSAHSYSGRNPASAREISEAIDITGQSRNLSMGLMFQRDHDKVSFGSPRTNYKDKITSSQTNY